MPKVLITPRSYAKYNDEIYALWNKENFDVIREEGPLSDDRMNELIENVDALIVGTDSVTENTLKYAKNLKIISKYGVGIDNIPKEFAEENGIKVVNTPGVNTEAVADYTISLLLAVARHVPQSHVNLARGKWKKMIGIEVYQKTIGILGFGAIGRAVAKRAKGFDMNVLAYDAIPNYEAAQELGVAITSFEEIIRNSDFISVHLPLMDETRNLINYEVLNRMKKNSIIVNTARGGIIDEEDLSRALKDGTIAGAGLDVFSEEPLKSSPLLGLENAILTPHNAAASIEATKRMTLQSTENVIKFFKENKVRI